MTYYSRPYLSYCQCKCAGGRKCVLQNSHEQHICNDPTCICHDAAAWGLERVTVRGVTQYRRVQWLEVPR